MSRRKGVGGIRIDMDREKGVIRDGRKARGGDRRDVRGGGVGGWGGGNRVINL